MEQTQKQVQEQATAQSQDIHQIQNQVITIGDKVDEILTLLTGNELDPESGGMIKKFANHEKRISDLEKLRDRMIWFLIGASILGGFGLRDIIQLITNKP